MTLHDVRALVAYLEHALMIARRIKAELELDGELKGDDNGAP